MIYAFAIRLYALGIAVAAMWQPKARAWRKGRKNWAAKLRADRQAHPGPLIWLHAASLGEMEQGMPVAEALAKRYPQHRLLLTFFSPSGYTAFAGRKPYMVHYLPLDTRRNARLFLDIVQPEIALFVKYEVWVNFWKALHKRGIPLLLFSAVFRTRQHYFRPWAWPQYRKLLGGLEAILVQDRASADLLRSKGLEKVLLAGDTRFDRALQVRDEAFPLPAMENWQQGAFTLVAGSSWPPEEALAEAQLARFPEMKLILAPHLVDDDNISRLCKRFGHWGLCKYSDADWAASKRVLLIDNMGLLKKLYRFGHFALVGGGLGPGVHSTIEPLVYRLPLAFGPRHQKFIEPSEMLARGFAWEVSSAEALSAALAHCLSPEYRAGLSKEISAYLAEKGGAVDQVVQAASRCLPDRT